jgi:hypothetical protein
MRLPNIWTYSRSKFMYVGISECTQTYRCVLQIYFSEKRKEHCVQLLGTARRFTSSTN